MNQRQIQEKNVIDNVRTLSNGVCRLKVVYRRSVLCKYTRTHTHKTDCVLVLSWLPREDRRCSLCKDIPETVQHITTWCKMQEREAPSEAGTGYRGNLHFLCVFHMRISRAAQVIQEGHFFSYHKNKQSQLKYFFFFFLLWNPHKIASPVNINKWHQTFINNRALGLSFTLFELPKLFDFSRN